MINIKEKLKAYIRYFFNNFMLNFSIIVCYIKYINTTRKTVINQFDFTFSIVNTISPNKLVISILISFLAAILIISVVGFGIN